jgi:hypothetical protein
MMCMQAADQCNFSAIAYEFVKEGLLIYECEISDSKAQIRALTNIIGTLLNCRNFPTEDYEALITKTAQYANKLLKKPDQCRMVTLCSHLFWPRDIPPVQVEGEEPPEPPVQRYSDCDRVLECMQRSLKIASVCNPNIFVEILDRCDSSFASTETLTPVYMQIYLLLRKQQSSDPRALHQRPDRTHQRADGHRGRGGRASRRPADGVCCEGALPQHAG